MTPSAPDRPHCLLCGQAGVPLFSGMSDRICGTPGEYTIRECARCELAWLDSDPVEEPHGAGYYTHAATSEHLREQAELAPRIRSVLAGRLKYDAVGPGAGGKVATAVSAWRRSRELARGARIEEMGSGSARGPAAVGFALVEGALAGWSDAGEECLLIATVQ